MRLFFSAKQCLTLLSQVLLCLCSFVSYQSIGVEFKTNKTNDSTQPLRIAVAANFTPSLKKLLVDFHQQTNIKTQVISGASGAMFVQIQHGAPFDIFISADSLRPLKLEQAGLVVANSRKTYAQGQLALFSMGKQAQLSDLQYLSQSPLQRLAIANPNTAPYGAAAKQTLEYLGLWQKMKDMLVVGINVSQTYMQVHTQAVNSGLVAYSQLLENDLKGTIIPPIYHQPINQQLVILKNSTNKNKAKKLSDYLLTHKIQQKIMSMGYAKIIHANKERG